MFKAFLASCALFAALAASQPSNASCYGYAGPGGPCSMGPGGGLSMGPGGGLSMGPGGGLSMGPGGGLSMGPNRWRRVPGF
jgi:hypothetical protein